MSLLKSSNFSKETHRERQEREMGEDMRVVSERNRDAERRVPGDRPRRVLTSHPHNQTRQL
ncbi:hypothetical protein HanPI659440_Chr11g0428991 [Helianthus annuus]|nr:hypothetical protein HanPI659440_Chr11g0428991 [Helianthus annuus]